jgi:uncharacterized membrane protein YraQ (UPF0718 family)
VLVSASISFLGTSTSIVWLDTYCHATHELLGKMWWGILLGIAFVGLLHHIPRNVIVSILGRSKGFSGLLRATLAGLLLDMCSHGILLVGLKLYERGATLGQTMAFLIASPWNSLSLTLVLCGLIGIPWTLSFIFLSAVIALVSGALFEYFVERNILPENPNRVDMETELRMSEICSEVLKGCTIACRDIFSTLKIACQDSVMIIRWMMLGIVLAGALRAGLSPEQFSSWFGPHLTGLGATLLLATVFEACSEGSSPIAADILNLGKSPGNAFAFLMTGVATDYTEIMGIRERTRSWKIALFLPLVTVPQVVLIALLLNL